MVVTFLANSPVDLVAVGGKDWATPRLSGSLSALNGSLLRCWEGLYKDLTADKYHEAEGRASSSILRIIHTDTCVHAKV